MRLRFMFATLSLFVMGPTLADAKTKTLPISPVSQKLPAWCWLASGEMVFRYYGIPNFNPAGIYQCGLAAAVFGGPCLADCRWCVFGSGPAQTIKEMIIYYPTFVQNAFHLSTPNLTAELIADELSEDDLRDEIDSGRPIIAGISPHSGLLPPGLSEHAVVIVGYDESGDDLFLLVNDPFPYDQAGAKDPYTPQGGHRIAPGRYRIPYRTMVNDLAWGNSIYGIQKQ
jgi:hypothetical protein